MHSAIADSRQRAPFLMLALLTWQLLSARAESTPTEIKDAQAESVERTGRLMMQDAEQWIRYGLYDAARHLARRAATLDIEWSTGEVTPTQLLADLDRRQYPEPIPRQRQPTRDADVSAAPLTEPSTGTPFTGPASSPSAAPAQRSAAHRNEILEGVGSAQERNRSAVHVTVPDPNPTATIQPPSSNSVHLYIYADAARLGQSGGISDDRAVPHSPAADANRDRMAAVRRTSEPVQVATGARLPLDRTVSPAPETPARPIAAPVSHLQRQSGTRPATVWTSPIVCFLVGLLICPATLLAGIVMTCRALGLRYPCLRIELVSERTVRADSPHRQDRGSQQASVGVAAANVGADEVKVSSTGREGQFHPPASERTSNVLLQIVDQNVALRRQLSGSAA